MASNTRAAVVAVFRSVSDARAVEADLRASGVKSDEIYISSGEGVGQNAASQREGGFVGWLKRTFSEGDEADRRSYESAFRSGNILVSVDTREEDVNAIADILSHYSPLAVQSETGVPREAAASTSAAAGAGATPAPGRSVAVLKEELKICKRAVLRGRVHVYSRVVQQPVEEGVRLPPGKALVDKVADQAKAASGSR